MFCEQLKQIHDSDLKKTVVCTIHPPKMGKESCRSFGQKESGSLLPAQQSGEAMGRSEKNCSRTTFYVICFCTCVRTGASEHPANGWRYQFCALAEQTCGYPQRRN